MTRHRATWTLALAVVSGCPAAAVAQNSVSSALEIDATRRSLSTYRAAFIEVDSLFAVPSQAPPALTARARPHARQGLLAQLIQSSRVTGAVDTIRIRASDPEIRGRTATISVTVGGTARGGRRFYETVAYVFEFDGTRWQLRSRVQLGVS